MERLKRLIEKCRNYRSVYVYGDGEVGRLLRVFLHEQGIEIDGFITTNEPVRKTLMDVSVSQLGCIYVDFSKTLVIICMHKKWWDSVSRELNNQGYSNYVIIDDGLRKEVESKVLFRDVYQDVERKINVLLYHRVDNLETSYSIMVCKKYFEEQLRYIKNNFDVLSCSEEWSHVDHKAVALTFDDGYVDFCRSVYPLLKKYQIPATVFVATSGIDNDKEFWWDELEGILSKPVLPEIIKTKRKQFDTTEYDNRPALIMDIRNDVIDNTFEERDKEIRGIREQVDPGFIYRQAYRTMNTDEIRMISKDPLISVGAHTVNHILCDHENKTVQYKEIKESKEKLEGIIEKPVELFAYPNGNIGKETRGILRDLGFMRAFTCEHACIDHDDNPFDIPRCAVLNWEPEQLERRFRGMWQTSKDI